MLFGLCNTPSTFQKCMVSIFSDFLKKCIEVFMDDFTVNRSYFDNCLDNLSWVLHICIKTNIVLNYEKCYFIVEQDTILGYIVFKRGIEVDPTKIDAIS